MCETPAGQNHVLDAFSTHSSYKYMSAQCTQIAWHCGLIQIFGLGLVLLEIYDCLSISEVRGFHEFHNCFPGPGCCL